jgi:uncharacterized protein YeaO (DUF488 family)
MIKIKRIYDALASEDAFRIFIDRLWPRSLSKEKVRLDLWLRDIAPSDKLRKWFAHDPQKWVEFKQKYFHKLIHKSELVDLTMKKSKEGNLTLLYGAKDKKFNNAVA